METVLVESLAIEAVFAMLESRPEALSDTMPGDSGGVGSARRGLCGSKSELLSKSMSKRVGGALGLDSRTPSSERSVGSLTATDESSEDCVFDGLKGRGWCRYTDFRFS